MDRFKSTLIGLILGCILLTGVSNPASAQEEKERKTKETVAMSQQVYEKLAEIQELIEGKDYASAERMLDELRGQKKLSDYERAQLWNLSGYSYYLQERYADAIRSYDQMLAIPELPEALLLSTLKTKAQLHFTQEDYESALSVVRQLLAAIPEPSADILMIEGQALFQLARYDEALVPIKTAIEMYRDQGQVPKENWLLLLRVIYFEQKEYELMIGVVKELIAYYPKDTYILTRLQRTGRHQEATRTDRGVVREGHAQYHFTHHQPGQLVPDARSALQSGVRSGQGNEGGNRRVQRAQPEARFASLVPGA